ncbi:hypothetical protein DFP72DRAFT_1132241 [Ephemerocybe angulata]|uniref:BTB domain-containing protein n=1 Tax=Ephemerocybe angulata TaxID=980116 RepID=A0A8H6HVZ3_9AGAR|nr:hypothetical protein DFP72DRAFT_1132241 [Tulosesus angulatus]
MPSPTPSPTTSEAKPETVSEDHRWSLVTFKVEDKLYRVPRHGFTDFSSVFETMFSLPQADTTQEGDTDEAPIVLPSCTKVEFESLLRVMYPTAPRVRQVDGSKEHWVHVLKLATLWDMQEIQETAIAELEGLNLGQIEKIRLAKEYWVSDWLVEGLTDIVQTWGTSTTLDELGRELGWEAAARLVDLAVQFKPMKGKGTAQLPAPICPEKTCNKRHSLSSFAFEFEGDGIDPLRLTETCTSCTKEFPVADIEISSACPMGEEKLSEEIKVLFGEELKSMELHDIV